MNAFQWVSLSLLLILLLRDLALVRRGSLSRGGWLFRSLVWLLAGAAIAEPMLPQMVATALGIGRAADLVAYIFILAFLMTSFYFYSRCVRLQRQITAVVRHLAIQQGQRGNSSSQLGQVSRGEQENPTFF